MDKARGAGRFFRGPAFWDLELKKTRQVSKKKKGFPFRAQLYQKRLNKNLKLMCFLKCLMKGKIKKNEV
ncbi:MAG: hypothetical protein CM15mP58_20540 [Burkholderiaceae bacterium]|nr:MAG: hypothetical protein CM15mP58_20540 [Burkholderiaceae bacterium]